MRWDDLKPFQQGLPDTDFIKSGRDALSGAAAGTAGLPVDMIDLITTLKALQTNPAAFQTAKPSAGSSDWFGEEMGADIESPEYIAGSFFSPSPIGKGAALAGLGAMAVKKADKLIPHAERMKRAADQGFNLDVFHSTPVDFDAFSDRGWWHSGNYGQANKRSQVLEDAGYYGVHRDRGQLNPNVLPLKARINNPFIIPDDLGNWEDPASIIGKLARKAMDTDYDLTRELRKAQDKIYWGEDEKIPPGMLNPNNKKGVYDLLTEVFERNGYDGIKYLNKYENEGGVGSITPHRTWQAQKLQDVYKKSEADLMKKYEHLPPDEREVYLEENWRNFLKRPDYQKSRERLDPYSYIAFRPEQYRSIFANFDPDKINDKNLLSSHPLAGAGAGLIAALAAMSDEEEGVY